MRAETVKAGDGAAVGKGTGGSFLDSTAETVAGQMELATLSADARLSTEYANEGPWDAYARQSNTLCGESSTPSEHREKYLREGLTMPGSIGRNVWISTDSKLPKVTK